MPIIERLEDYHDTGRPLVLTIGTFDGMHRGHLAVLRQAQALATSEGGEVLVLTFRNHPSQVLRPEHPTLLLCTLDAKLLLLQQLGIQHIALLPFTSRLAKHSAESFIENVRQFIPFSHLVLGYDATLGRNRQGDRVKMEALAMEWGFNLHYADEYRYEGKAVSSSRIRQALSFGELPLVEELLSRPFSIYAKVAKADDSKQSSDFLLLHFNLEELCLPPIGSYNVEINVSGYQPLIGIATLKGESSVPFKGPEMEVYLKDKKSDWQDEMLEIVFKDALAQ